MIDFNKPVKIAVASPSYRRPFCRTAQYLPQTRIYVDGSEVEQYEKANNGNGVVVRCADGVQGNLPRVRNYILDTEFNENGADIVVMMDDDVSQIGMFKPNPETGFGYEKFLITKENFEEFILYGSLLCQEWGFGMWGVNHNEDKLLYRHFVPFRTTVPSVGQFMVFVKNELRFDENLPLKEDYDMALQQINKYRGVLMLSFAWVNGDFGNLSGGTAVRRNQAREQEQFRLFKKKWGSDIVIGTNKHTKANHDGVAQGYINEYDFSHPRLKIPIEGA